MNYQVRSVPNILGNDPYGGYSALVSQDSFSLFLNRVASAVPVNEETAMAVPAVSNAVTMISSAVAGLPILAYKKKREKNNKFAKLPIGQSWDKILNKRWTPYEPSFQARQRLMVGILLHGYGYIYLARNKHDLVRELHVLDPTCVSADDLYEGYSYPQMYYNYDGKNYGVIPDEIPIKDIAYVPFLPMATDLTRSYGLLTSGREAIASSLALMLYVSGYFDSISAGSYSAESPFTGGEDHDRFKEQINDAVLDMVRNRSRVFVTPQGTKFSSISVDNRKSQFVETQVENVRQIARTVGCPPVMIGELSGSNWSTQEINSYLANHVIKRWTNSIEQAVTLKLFPDPKDDREIMFDLQDLQKANVKERAEAARAQVYSGQKTPNEIRASNGDPPIDHELADELFMQSATVPLSLLEQMQQSNSQSSDPADPVDSEETDPEDPDNEQEMNRLLDLLLIRSAGTNGSA